MKRIYLYICLVAVLLTGCTKSLDLHPLDTISDATFWKSAADFKLAANNLYNSLSQYQLTGDLESDIAYSVNNPVSNGTYTLTETNSDWTNSYYYIRNCNKIIQIAEQSTLAKDAEVLRYFVAEAKFFRAWNYWILFRLYGGVPIIKDVPDINSEVLYKERASRKETVDFILQDLTDASGNLPLKSALSSIDVGRITKGTSLALKARIALFEGTWGKYRSSNDFNGYLDMAIESSNDIINSAQYSLYSGSGTDSYRNLFIEPGDDSPECILDDRYEVNVRGQGMPKALLEGRYLATKKLADMYLCSDGLPINQSSLFQGYNSRTSEYQSRDPRMGMTLLIPGTLAEWKLFPDKIESWPFFPQRNGNTGYTTNKFRSENVWGNSASSQDHGYDTHIIRYAEVMLIFAEATFEKNNTISDADLNKSINVMRSRVGMVSLTNAFVSSNGLDMKLEIRRERTIELALEGFRYDDLRRWKTAEIEMPQAIKGIKIVGTQWGTDPIIVSGIDKNPYLSADYQIKADANGILIAEPATARHFDPAKHYLRPLPTKEILINDKLEQNPEW